MIKIFMCVCSLSLSISLTAQQPDVTQTDLNNWALYNSGSKMSSTGAINVFESKTATKGSRYLVSGWVSGEIVNLKKESINSAMYRFNYDKILQQLYLLIDSSVIELDPEKIYSFKLRNPDSLNGRKYFLFVRNDLITGTKKNRIFFEQLYKNKEFEILKFPETRFFRADLNDRRPGGTNEPLFDRYEVQNYYYVIFHNRDLKKLKPSKKELVEIFPAKASTIEKYFEEHSSGNQLAEEEFIQLLGSF
jgi:hypothetical protein